MKDNRLSLSNVRCSYFDSSVLGNIKKTKTRIYQIFEIAYYLEDGGTFTRNGAPCKIRKDHLRICVPGREGGGNILPFQILCLKFEAEGMLADRIAKIPTYFQTKRPKVMREAFRDLLALCHEVERNELLIYSRTLSLLELIISEADAPKRSNSPTQQAVTDAKKYIEKNYQRPIRLLDVSTAVHLCPTYFHTVFTRECGMTPHDYITEYRIHIAKNLLFTTPLTLCEIAERCGFCNQQYMSSVFKARTGLSPTQCRKEYQKEYVN